MRESTCTRCGEQFEYKPKKLYCDPCRTLINRERSLRRHHDVYVSIETQSRKCALCGVEFMPTITRQYCFDKCRYKANRERAKLEYIANKALAIVPKPSRPAPKSKRVDLDAEQRRLNLAIDARFSFPCEYRHLTPKHPDFMSIANIYLQRFDPVDN